MTQPYDPLDYGNLALSVVGALLRNDPGPLPPAERLEGCGVYAIYYVGKVPFYASIASSEFKTPIYVGKAIPVGGRKGGDGGAAGAELHKRLDEHADSICAVKNLAIQDFRCRALVVVPVWITLAERFLIDHFRPVWNTVLDGFGNHNPGEGRATMRRPRWDIVHPGRTWAARLRAAETAEDLIRRISKSVGHPDT